ncbi:hypothetical protein LINGRAHAP2_LOCUS22109 [Linum grandiflorum]
MYYYSCRAAWSYFRSSHGLGVLGFRKVNIQLYSQCVVDALLGDPSDDLHHSSCIREARYLLQRSWDVTVSHTFHEGNRVADALPIMGTLGHLASLLFLIFLRMLLVASGPILLVLLYPRMILVNN